MDKHKQNVGRALDYVERFGKVQCRGLLKANFAKFAECRMTYIFGRMIWGCDQQGMSSKAIGAEMRATVLLLAQVVVLLPKCPETSSQRHSTVLTITGRAGIHGFPTMETERLQPSRSCRLLKKYF